MQLGLQLLESNINALCSQIELEKTERDQSFQNLVTIFGGGAAIFSALKLDEEVKGSQCRSLRNSINNTPGLTETQKQTVLKDINCNNIL